MTIANKLYIKLLKISKVLLLFLFFIPTLGLTYGGKEDHEEGEPFNPAEMINHHIADAHSWEIFHGLTIHLPVILYSGEKGLEFFSSSNFYDDDHQIKPHKGYILEHEHISLKSGQSVLDLSITKNVIFLIFNAVLLILVFSAVARGYKKNKGHAPKGVQSLFEPIILFVRDEIAKANIGDKKYEKFLPFLLTVFFFIWFGNMIGLLPGAANLTGNISITLTMAVMVLIITLFSGKKTYWLHILDPLGSSMSWSGKGLLYLILWPVEIIGIFTKPFSLMIRLFANITAGHILILSILGLAFVFKSVGVGIVGAVFAIVMNMLELFVAFLQAFVFTLLASMYFGQAVEEAHH